MGEKASMLGIFGMAVYKLSEAAAIVMCIGRMVNMEKTVRW